MFRALKNISDCSCSFYSFWFYKDYGDDAKLIYEVKEYCWKNESAHELNATRVCEYAEETSARCSDENKETDEVCEKEIEYEKNYNYYVGKYAIIQMIQYLCERACK